MCVEGRKLNGDQRFKIIFRSLKNVPVRWYLHNASKVLCVHKKVRRSPMNCQTADGSFTKSNANGLCVGRTLTTRY